MNIDKIIEKCHYTLKITNSHKKFEKTQEKNLTPNNFHHIKYKTRGLAPDFPNGKSNPRTGAARPYSKESVSVL
jgi:hypothetical protein